MQRHLQEDFELFSIGKKRLGFVILDDGNKSHVKFGIGVFSRFLEKRSLLL